MKKKRNLDFSKLLDNNNVIRIISVVIAIVAWFIVAITIDDNQVGRVDDVPLRIDYMNSTPEQLGLQLIEGADQTISVKVEGIRIEIGSLTADDIVAVPDFSKVTKAGEQDVKVYISQATSTDSYRIVDRTVTVKMTFDMVSTRTFDVQGVADNVTAEEGFRKDKVTANPGKLEISGPQSEISLIDRCAVEYNETLVATDTIVRDGRLVFYDQNGNPLNEEEQLPHVTYPEEDFSVTISILMMKTVPVKVNFLNDNGKAADLKYTLSAEEIAIAGSKGIVEGIEDVTIGPIDFASIEAGAVFSYDVILDAGVYNEDNIDVITVTIDPSAYSETTLDIEKDHILVRNQPVDLDVSITSNGINNVTLVGDTEDISLLASKELYAYVDLRNLQEGTVSLPVTIYSTGDKYVWAVGEYYVTVKATAKE